MKIIIVLILIIIYINIGSSLRNFLLKPSSKFLSGLRALIIPSVSSSSSEQSFSRDFESHDFVTYRKRSGDILFIPQAERYSTRDWLHNLRTLPTSYLLTRIKTVILFNTIWSILACTLYKFVKFSSPGAKTHSLLGSALGLLLVFRTNTAYNRFWEGRNIWDRIMSTTRNAASMIISYGDAIPPHTVNKLLNLLCAFPWCLMEHIQGIRQTKPLKKLLDEEELQKLELVTNRPLFLIHRMNQHLRYTPDAPSYTNRERIAIMKLVEELSKSIGSCERLVQTPVPLSYARHTSRFLTLWSLSLPFALVSEIGWTVVPFSVLVSWALFGIQEIGMIIEEPFRHSLQLDVFAKTIRRDLSDLVHIAAFGGLNRLEVTSPALRYKEPFFRRSKQSNSQQHNKDSGSEIEPTNRTIKEADNLAIDGSVAMQDGKEIHSVDSTLTHVFSSSNSTSSSSSISM